MFYSKTTGGFYSTAIHGDNMPADAVEISTKAHAALMAGQAAGKVIASDEAGFPILVEKKPTAEQLAEKAEAMRAAAYREESDPLFFKWQRDEATKDEWLAKVAEIKARFPGNPTA